MTSSIPDESFLRTILLGLGLLFVAAVIGLLVMSCSPKYTAQDRAGDLAAEAMFAREYALDAGPQVRTYGRAGLCAVQANLARHDAGRLVSQVSCEPKREP